MQLFHMVSSLFYVYYVRDCLPNVKLNKQAIHITTVDTRRNKDNDTRVRHKLCLRTVQYVDSIRRAPLATDPRKTIP